MKILVIRFKNLNSLAGEWEIDLQDPVFTSSGIFAITGPTGSGKSTILDAICLALYGRTPRLDKISASVNEIMTRQTGECFAEVTFTSYEGTFRCNWRQKRAGKRSDGKFQQPEHDITDVLTGKVLESKIRDVGIKVRQVTGMSFEQFTRSMLLAQGGFAAFLEAKPDDRAPILEQITGTEIYSDISIRVHDRTGQERVRLRTLEEQAGTIQILSPEEEAALQTEKIEKETDVTAHTITLHELRDRLELLTRIDGLKLDIQGLESGKKSLVQRRANAEDDLKRLEKARLASPLESEWKVLSGLEEKEIQNRTYIAGLHDQIAEVKLDCVRTETDLDLAESRYQESKREFETQNPIITKVRKYDGEIAGLRKNLFEVNNKVAEQESRRIDIDSDLKTLELQRNSYITKKDLDDSYLKEHNEDALLIAVYPDLHHQLTVLDDYQITLGGLTRDLQISEECLHKAEMELDLKTQCCSSCESEINRIQGKVTCLKDQISILLAGSPLTEWKEKERELKVTADLLKKLLDTAIRMETLRESKDRFGKRIGELTTFLDEQIRVRSEQLIHQNRQENLVENLELTALLAARVRDLEEERKRLKAGEPCPLCGSEVHPYISGNIATPGLSETQLAEARADLKTIIARISQIDVSIATLDQDLIRHQEELLNTEGLITETEVEWHTGAVTLRLDPDTRCRSDSVKSVLDENEQKMAETDAVIAHYDTILLQLRTAEQELSIGMEGHTQIHKELQEALYTKTRFQDECSRLSREKHGLATTITQILGSLHETLSPFRVTDLTLENIRLIDDDLRVRGERYQKSESDRVDLNHRVDRLTDSIDIATRRMNELVEELSLINTERVRIQNCLVTFEQERAAIYGAKNPDIEEQCILIAVKSAENDVGLARSLKEEKQKIMDTLNGQVQSLTASLGTLKADIVEKTSVFLQNINESGFLDIPSFQAALLPLSVFTRIETMERDLIRDETSLFALLQDKQQTLIYEIKKVQGPDTAEDLTSSIEKITGEIDTLQEEIIRIRLRLEENIAMIEKISEKWGEIEAQRKELHRWERLHSLIGSADGKKFRVFAQGLTFQLLITQANRNLRMMTDRYILRSDPINPLDLAVNDTWQAGEVRSTRNLSGGESFIVSLALALGLSGMASRNVRVDSLFLDEGFGTLDDEALDTALSALSGLHQQEKLIGIISHVPAIKDRITARITVEKRNSGRSAIIAPGCRRIS